METVLIALIPTILSPILTELIKRLSPNLGGTAWKIISTVLGLLASIVTSTATGTAVTPDSLAMGATAGAAGTVTFDAARGALRTLAGQD